GESCCEAEGVGEQARGSGLKRDVVELERRTPDLDHQIEVLSYLARAAARAAIDHRQVQRRASIPDRVRERLSFVQQRARLLESHADAPAHAQKQSAGSDAER